MYYVCMYVCMYVRMYVGMYICIYVPLKLVPQGDGGNATAEGDPTYVCM